MTEGEEMDRQRQKVAHARKWSKFYAAEVERCMNVIASYDEQMAQIKRLDSRARSILSQAKAQRHNYDSVLEGAIEKLSLLERKYGGAPVD